MPRTPLYDRLFRALLRLFPAEFRGDFGAAMVDDFRDQRADAVHSGGPRSVAGLWLRTVTDIIVRAPREHLDILIRDAGYALRLLRRRPGFAAGTLLTLVIAIGLNTAVFSVVHGVLWRELPYPDSHRLVRLFEVKSTFGEQHDVSSANFLDWRAESKTLDGVALVNRTSATLIGTGDPEDVAGMLVSEDFFSVLRTRPALGRVLQDRDFEPLRVQVRDLSRREAPTPGAVVIADALWRGLFQTQPDIIGRGIRLDGTAVEIVGVMPPDFGFSRAAEPEPAQFWLPVAANPVQRRARYLAAIGRLAPNAGLGDAQAELDVIGRRLAAAYPADDAGWGIRVRPLRDTIIASVPDTAVDSPRSCCMRPADRLRQRDKSAAGPCVRPPARVGHTRSARGEPRSPRAADADGEPRDRCLGRRRRMRAGTVGCAFSGCTCALQHPPSRGSDCKPASADLYRRDLSRGQRGNRCCGLSVDGSSRSHSHAARSGRSRQRRPAIPTRADSCRDCARSRARDCRVAPRYERCGFSGRWTLDSTPRTSFRSGCRPIFGNSVPVPGVPAWCVWRRSSSGACRHCRVLSPPVSGAGRFTEQWE